MSKRSQITKLFAVVALAAAPAAAKPHQVRAAPASAHAVRSEVQRAVVDPWAGQPAPVPAPPPVASQPSEIVGAVLAVFGITAPRRLPSGAPACGNVQSKVQRSRIDCEPEPEATTAIGVH